MNSSDRMAVCAMRNKLSCILAVVVVIFSFLVLPDTTYADPFESKILFLFNPDGFEYTPVRKGPTSDSDIIGNYYNGISVIVNEVSNGWACIQTGYLSHDVQGFVPVECLIEQIGMPRIWVATARSRQPAESPNLLSEPSSIHADVLGNIPAGTRLRLMGTVKKWGHVSLGNDVSGFILLQDLEIKEEEQNFLNSSLIPPLGYAYVNKVYESTWDSPLTVYSLPDENADVALQAYGGNGMTFSLLADLGDWCEVADKHSLGFIKSQDVWPIQLNKLFILEDESYTDGSYIVDSDLPSGLYTLFVPKGGAASLQISGTNSTNDRVHSVSGEAHYTLFLPEHAQVKIQGGVLKPMTKELRMDEGTNWSLTGNGRFFAELELSNIPDISYQVNLLPDADTGYVEVTNMIYQAEQPPEGGTLRIKLDKNTQPQIGVTVPSGCFIEMHNCKITVIFPNG